MTSTTNTTSNKQSVHDCCIMCFGSFGVQQPRSAWKCIDVKCGQQCCNRCLQLIQTYNGNDRPYRCMYCLTTYAKNQMPKKDESLERQLWDEAKLKYGIKRSHQLLSTHCNSKEFIFDIDCRRHHLTNLIFVWNRTYHQTQSYTFITDAHDMAKKLSEIIQNVETRNANMDIWKRDYRRVISTSSDNEDIGLHYIHLCEDLQLEISDSQCYSMFPNTYRKLNKWMHEQGSSNEFQPKILNLFEEIEKDLSNQCSNSNLEVRTKIGVMGYTSAGKSSVTNRLLGVKSLIEDGAAPVSTNKSTYFPLQYDPKDAFIHPDNPERKTFVTFVDMQGLDKNRTSDNSEVEAGNYLDEIRKADCDIYILVHDEEFSEEQHKWIIYIEATLKRKCVLVRSKIDIHYLTKFREHTNTFFGRSTLEQQTAFDPIIIEQLRQDNSVNSYDVFLVGCEYCPNNTDAEILQEKQSFDFPKLVNHLSRLAFDGRSHRIHALAHRTIARAINTCFRRGYILNVLKYKVAAGCASLIPFGDKLPRYLAEDGIRDAFGIDDGLCQYLKQFDRNIDKNRLQTSVFGDCVTIPELQNNLKVDTKCIVIMAGVALAIGAVYADDIIRLATPSAAGKAAARIAFSVATSGLEVVISSYHRAWSEVVTGNHVFSYINRTCDDIIMITNPLITSIIDRERQKVFGNNDSTP